MTPKPLLYAASRTDLGLLRNVRRRSRPLVAADNFQEDPKGEVVHSNVADEYRPLSLSCVVAHELGYISWPLLSAGSKTRSTRSTSWNASVAIS